ncbi:MAG TPA: TetR/AcrR family transcriptional regulator [Dermatophilaceae bacterium]|nr:TetR/AcrR family transcriptional regulator [Dermatophilaceae bacterium]
MTTSLPAQRGQRMPRSERRAQLLRAAQDVFVSRGYHAAAMDEIADRAGVSKPVLYQHFPGKLDLYLALLDQHCDTLERLVREALALPAEGNHARVAATIGAYYEFVSREGAAFRMVFESDLTSVPQVRARLDGVELACAEAIADVIAQDTGVDDERAMLLGTGLSGMAQITARYWLAQGGSIPRDEAASLVVALAWGGLGSFPKVDGHRPGADGEEGNLDSRG